MRWWDDWSKKTEHVLHENTLQNLLALTVWNPHWTNLRQCNSHFINRSMIIPFNNDKLYKKDPISHVQPHASYDALTENGQRWAMKWPGCKVISSFLLLVEYWIFLSNYLTKKKYQDEISLDMVDLHRFHLKRATCESLFHTLGQCEFTESLPHGFLHPTPSHMTSIQDFATCSLHFTLNYFCELRFSTLALKSPWGIFNALTTRGLTWWPQGWEGLS